MNKKDAYYFPHFSNARNDAKLIKLRRVMGIEGYGMYFLILEVLREQNDFKLPLYSLEDLAYEWHTSKEKLISVVGNFDLFIIDENNFFFSEKQILYLQPYFEKTHRARAAANKRWKAVKEINNANAMQMQCSGNANAMQRQCKCNAAAMQGKERKGKESKVKESKVKEEAAKNKFLQESNLLNNIINVFDKKIIESLTPAQALNWKETINKLHRIDGYDYEIIKEVIKWGREDDFWSQNFHSIAGLRKKTNNVSKFYKIKTNYENRFTNKKRGNFTKRKSQEELLENWVNS